VTPPTLFTPAMWRVSVTLFLGALVPNLFVLASRYLGAAGYDEQDIGVAMGAFNVAALFGTPTVGWVTTRWGHARVVAAGCVLTATGAIVFDLSTTLPGYALARAIQGFGFSGVLVGAASYVAETAPAPRLGQALGISGVLTLTAQAVGPVLGKVALAVAGWPWLFRTGAVAGFLGALVALSLPPAPRRPPADEERAVGARAALVATMLAGIGFGVIWTFIADYAPRAGVGDPNWFFVAYVVAAVSTRLLLGTLSDRIGRREAAAPALAGHALVLIGMALVSAPWQAIAIGLGYGLGHGIYYPALQALIVERSGGRRGGAIAASTFAFGIGGVIAAFGLGPVARAFGYPVIYVVAAAASAAAAALVRWRT
jgi:MFS family permease